MSKFRKVINFLLFFCAILCSMLVITVNSENTVPIDGICENGHSLDVVQEKTYQNGCLVCNLADMINDLPSESEITEDNCVEVAQQIQEIDKIKFDLTDEGYEELEKIVGKNVPKYFEAIAALQDLMGNVNLVAAKKFVLEDGAVLDSNDEILKDVSISVEVTPIVGDSAIPMFLNEPIEEPSGKTWVGPTQTFDLSYNSDTNGLVGTYSLPAGGKYRVREVNTNQPIVIDGKTYYTKSVSYTYNGNTVMSDDGIEVTTYAGDDTVSITLWNTYSPSVFIQAVDADERKLEGAEFKIDNDDIQITWNDGTETYKVEGLKTEETYTLTVTEAPEGYILPAENITFSIDDHGTISVGTNSGSGVAEVVDNTIKVKFEKTKVQIQAVDANGQALEGAEFKILNSGKNVTGTEWTSATEAHTVEGLKIGGTYTLKVTVAPKGYILPADITFSINSDGSIDYGEEKHYANGVYVVLFDKVPTQNNNQNGNNNSGNKWNIENFESKEINGIKHYFDGGRTYVKIPETPGIVWLKEESDGTSAWYGLDNSSSTFEPNSIFYVEWHSPDSSKYDELYSQLDENIKSQIEDENGWIFQTGVLNQAGDKITEIKNLPVNLYVQIGDDWDLKDLKSVYIQSQSDENTDVTYVENLKYPEGTDNFGIMKLKHFSPYFIYDTEDDIITDEDPIDNNTTENTQENIENTDKNNNSNINDSIATGDETTKTIILVSILVIIISGLIIFLSLRRKK